MITTTFYFYVMQIENFLLCLTTCISFCFVLGGYGEDAAKPAAKKQKIAKGTSLSRVESHL